VYGVWDPNNVGGTIGLLDGYPPGPGGRFVDREGNAVRGGGGSVENDGGETPESLGNGTDRTGGGSTRVRGSCGNVRLTFDTGCFKLANTCARCSSRCRICSILFNFDGAFAVRIRFPPDIIPAEPGDWNGISRPPGVSGTIGNDVDGWEPSINKGLQTWDYRFRIVINQ